MGQHRRAAQWILLCLGIWLAPAAWAADGVIPPGAESHVLHLLLPYVHRGAVGPGARLTDIAIEPRRVLLTLATPASETAQVSLRPQSFGTGHSFASEALPTSSPVLREAQARLLAAVAVNDDGRLLAVPPRVCSPGR